MYICKRLQKKKKKKKKKNLEFLGKYEFVQGDNVHNTILALDNKFGLASWPIRGLPTWVRSYLIKARVKSSSRYQKLT